MILELVEVETLLIDAIVRLKGGTVKLDVEIRTEESGMTDP